VRGLLNGAKFSFLWHRLYCSIRYSDCETGSSYILHWRHVVQKFQRLFLEANHPPMPCPPNRKLVQGLSGVFVGLLLTHWFMTCNQLSSTMSLYDNAPCTIREEKSCFTCFIWLITSYVCVVRMLRCLQIAHSNMHHPVSGINSLIHSVSLASHVSTYSPPHSLVSSSLLSSPLSSSIDHSFSLSC